MPHYALFIKNNKKKSNKQKEKETAALLKPRYLYFIFPTKTEIEKSYFPPKLIQLQVKLYKKLEKP